MRWRENYQTRLGPPLSSVDLRVDAGRLTDPFSDYRNTKFLAAARRRPGRPYRDRSKDRRSGWLIVPSEP